MNVMTSASKNLKLYQFSQTPKKKKAQQTKKTKKVFDQKYKK